VLAANTVVRTRIHSRKGADKVSRGKSDRGCGQAPLKRVRTTCPVKKWCEHSRIEQKIDVIEDDLKAIHERMAEDDGGLFS